jgi:hypothetical protein
MIQPNLRLLAEGWHRNFPVGGERSEDEAAAFVYQFGADLIHQFTGRAAVLELSAALMALAIQDEIKMVRGTTFEYSHLLQPPALFCGLQPRFFFFSLYLVALFFHVLFHAFVAEIIAALLLRATFLRPITFREFYEHPAPAFNARTEFIDASFSCEIKDIEKSIHFLAGDFTARSPLKPELDARKITSRRIHDHNVNRPGIAFQPPINLVSDILASLSGSVVPRFVVIFPYCQQLMEIFYEPRDRSLLERERITV